MSTPPAPDADPREKLSWRGAGIIAALVFGIPALIGQGGMTQRRFDESALHRLEESRPRNVLLGDSMLQTRIDADRLSRLAGSTWESLAYPGSGSAHWYLCLKNLIAVQNPPPENLVIFFRDRQLTLASLRAEGRYRPRMESLMRGSEPRLDEIIASAGSIERDVLDRLSLAAYPLQRHRLEWQDKIQKMALKLTPGGMPVGAITSAAARRFDVRHLRADIGPFAEGDETALAPLDPKGHDFESFVERSFLPEILRLARVHGIRAVFFRVKQKPPREGEFVAESRDLKTYTRALRDYVEKAGALWVDESTDARVGLVFYGSDDHVRKSMMGPYTELFWERMRPLLGDGPGEGGAR